MKLIMYHKTVTAQVVTILIFLSLLMAPDNLISKSLSKDVIRPAVETWVRYVPADARSDAIVERMEPYVANGKTVAYIAYLADGGFCICGADDRFLPVYVYSPGGTFDPENEFCRYILEDMAQWIISFDQAQQDGDPTINEYTAMFSDRAAYWSDLASGIISRRDRGLYDGPNILELEAYSIWRQDRPFNYYCPKLPPDDAGALDTCIAGCVATAMAIIMRYWEWPVTGESTSETVQFFYRHASDWISEPLVHDPSIPAKPWVMDRLEWSPDEGGKLRMQGYWENSIKKSATKILPKYVLAGTSDGAFISTNNGDNWGNSSTGLTNTNIQTLAVNSDDDFFAGTYGGGVFRSINYGGFWQEKNNGLSYHLNIQAFAFTNDHVFVGIIGDGVYRSPDNGNNWEQVITGLTNLDVQTLAVNSNDDLFAGTDGGGVFISTNNGVNWDPAAVNPTNLDVQTLAVNSNDDLFAGTDGGGVFISTNNGANWDPAASNPTNLDIQTLVVNSNNDIFAGTNGGGVFISTDNGETWDPTDGNPTNLDIQTLAVNSSDDLFAGTNGGGVFISTDNGDNWPQKIDGLTEHNVKALAIPSCYQIAQDYLTALDLLYNRLTQESVPLDEDFGATTYQWHLMKDSYKRIDPIDDSAMAAATLSYHTGMSVNMDYGIIASSAGAPPESYSDHFRYDDDVEHVKLQAGNYGDAFDAMMDEIQWLRPIHYKGPKHHFVIHGYDRTFLPDEVLWRCNSGNGDTSWATLKAGINYNNDSLRFNRYIAPESFVRFVGSDVSGDGSPADPYLNIEEAVADATIHDEAILIFKAGSENTFSAAPLEISNRKVILRGKGAVIRKE
jgi:hypothetical protein